MWKQQCLIEKIQSKYILNTIFDYISNDDYKLKLFIHSKTLQNKFDLQIEYRYSFLKEYLNIKEFILLDLINEKLDTNYFYTNLNNILDFIHLTLEESKQISKIIYKNYIKEQTKNRKIYKYTDFLSTIDIYSPFIEFAISNDFHFINIPLDDIQKYNLKNDYISFFKKQNENNTKMKILISLKNAKQMDELNDLNIDFSKINQLVFVYMNNFYYSNSKNEKKDPFLNSIYSLINIPNNLEVLDLYFDKHYSIGDVYFPKWFNSLTNLKELKIRGLDFTSTLIISLPKLEIIILNFCEKIDFLHEIVDKNVKYVELINTPLISGKQHNFENLEELKISKSGLYHIDINFSCLKKLKKYSVSHLDLVEQISLFPLLEEFSFLPNPLYDVEFNNKTIFDFIISNKTMKKITIELPLLTNKDLANISIKNDNINDITLIKDNDSNYDIELLLKKFTNIKKLKLKNKKDDYSWFSIKEDKTIIIEELEMPNPFFSVSFSFSYLRTLSLSFAKYNNSFQYFSLFNSNCNTNFNNLQNLNLSISEEPFNMTLLSNFANNTKYFKNLKRLNFKFYIEDIDPSIYFYFIDKLLSLNLVELHIYFEINGWKEFYKFNFKLYRRKELKKLFKKKIKEDSKYIYKIQRVKTEYEEEEYIPKEKCLIL